MQVSVIMPAYDGERFIKESIESILAQTFKDFELVVVDDGSTDSTLEIVKSFDDERIKYFHKENSGNQAIPRNYGIKKAQGEFIAFCDQDDLWYPEKLEKQMAVIIQNSTRLSDGQEFKIQKGLDSLPRRQAGRRSLSARSFAKEGGNGKAIGIVVTSADIVNRQGAKIGERLVPAGFMDAPESFRKLLEEDFITACSALVPKKVIEEVGLLNGDLNGNDDYDLWLRITRKYGIFGIGEPLCAWRRSGESFSRDMSRIFKENEKIFNRLKAGDAKEKSLIEKGANLNLARLFVAYLREKQYDQAKETLQRIQAFEGMAQVKFAMKIFGLSPGFARLGLLFVNAIKKRS